MWKNIDINANQIITETEKAVLISCPRTSDFNGYSFWHPSKLVRNGKHSASLSIGYTDDFIFKLKKYGKGKFNRQTVIDEIEISVSDFEEMYEVTNENIRSPKIETESYLKIKEPTPIDVEVEVEECLKNN